MTTLPTTTPMRLPRPAAQTPLAIASPHAQQPNANSFQMNGSDVWRVIRSNLWLILVMLAVSVAAGFGLNWYLAKWHSSYTAYGFIEVNNIVPFRIKELDNQGTDVTGLALNQRTQAALLKQEALFIQTLQDPNAD